MSEAEDAITTSTPAAPSREQAEKAYQHLSDKVAADAFFSRLRQLGIQATTDKETADLIELSGMLLQVEQLKAASTGRHFSGSVEKLAGVLGLHQQDGDMQQGIKQAAAELLGDADVYNSVLCIRRYEAAAAARR